MSTKRTNPAVDEAVGIESLSNLKRPKLESQESGASVASMDTDQDDNDRARRLAESGLSDIAAAFAALGEMEMNEDEDEDDEEGDYDDDDDDDGVDDDDGEAESTASSVVVQQATIVTADKESAVESTTPVSVPNVSSSTVTPILTSPRIRETNTGVSSASKPVTSTTTAAPAVAATAATSSLMPSQQPASISSAAATSSKHAMSVEPQPSGTPRTPARHESSSHRSDDDDDDDFDSVSHDMAPWQNYKGEDQTASAPYRTNFFGFSLDVVMQLLARIEQYVHKNTAVSHKIDWSVIATSMAHVNMSAAQCQSVWRFIAYEMDSHGSPDVGALDITAVQSDDSDLEDSIERLSTRRKLRTVQLSRAGIFTPKSSATPKSARGGKRHIRKPSLRWSRKEDKLLLQAMLEHGSDWEAVMKQCKFIDPVKNYAEVVAARYGKIVISMRGMKYQNASVRKLLNRVLAACGQQLIPEPPSKIMFAPNSRNPSLGAVQAAAVAASAIPKKKDPVIQLKEKKLEDYEPFISTEAGGSSSNQRTAQQ